MNAAFLNEYERWMLAEGKRPKKASAKGRPASTTIIGIYLTLIMQWGIVMSFKVQ